MAKRPKVPKSVETKVLTQSLRRCCLCFGLNEDAAIKNGQIAHVDQDRTNNAIGNLAWLCLPHHDEYDSRPSQSKGITAEELQARRDELYRAIEANALPNDDESAPRNIPFPLTFQTTTGDKSTVINAAGNVNYNVRGRRKPLTVSPPPDAIGSSIEMLSYVDYLIRRYIEWRKKGKDRGIDPRPFFPGTIRQLVQKRFGARVPLIPQDRFLELVEVLQKAIDNTIWGKNSPNRNYHSFEEHYAKIRGKPTTTPP